MTEVLPAGAKSADVGQWRSFGALVDAHRVWVCAVLAGLTGVLVLPGLEARPFWLDEAYTVANARTPLPEIGGLNGGNMIGYYALVAPLARRPLDTLLWLRLPGAVAAILVPPAVFLVTRRVLPPWSALGGALLVAVHPVTVGHAQEARSYPIAMLLVVLAWGAFIRATREDERTRWWAALTVLLAAAAYMHLITLFVVPALFVSASCTENSARMLRRLLRVSAALSLAVAPLAWWALRTDEGAPVWIPELDRTQISEMARSLMPSAWPIGTASWTAVLILGLVMALRRGNPRLERREQFAGTAFAAWVLIPILGLAMVSLAKPMFMPRYVLYTVPAVAGMTVIALASLPRRSLQIAAYLVCLVLVASSYREASRPFDEAYHWPEVVCDIAAVPADALVVFPAPRDRTPVDLRTELQPGCTPEAMVWPEGEWGSPRRVYATGGWEELPLDRLPAEAWLVWRDIGLTEPLRRQAHEDLSAAGFERVSSTVYGYNIILEHWRDGRATSEAAG